jgi:hypothetical protein
MLHRHVCDKVTELRKSFGVFVVLSATAVVRFSVGNKVIKKRVTEALRKKWLR